MNSEYLHWATQGLWPLIVVMLGACSGGSNSPDTEPDPGTVPLPDRPETLSDRVTDHAFVSDHFSGSQNCASCHDGLQDAAGDDVSIVANWQATMMANSSRDPLWRAKVASEIKRNPGLREEIEATCSRCHVPMAHVEAGFASVDRNLLDDGFFHPDNPLFDAAAEGVSCTLCHQISDTAELGNDAGFSGGFDVPYEFGVDRMAFGQYENPLTMPMRNQVAFTPAMSPHISSSEVCATCHNLATPVLDSNGNLTDETFPEQMAYTEWENSDFAGVQSCQDCHMQPASGDVVISTRPMNGLEARADFSRHSFVGGNTYMLDILGKNAEALNITSTGFERLIEESRAFLGGSVGLALEGIESIGDQLRFDVRLTNHSGHKFPTSYPSRRAWLHVTLSNSQGVIVFESGAVDASGQISGLASDSDLGSFEPHYQTISNSDQVQSYETIMEDLDGNLTYTLLEAAAFRKDNRLLPSGMNKGSVPEEIRPQGAAFSDADFIGGSDLVSYQVSGLLAGTYRIDVRLNFQSVGYNFVQDLVKDDDEPRVALFRDLDENAAIRFETIQSVTENITF